MSKTKHNRGGDDTRIETVYVDPEAVQPHPENARQGDVGAIHASMNTVGIYRPIVVQRSTGYILAGNHTYRAMVQRGEDEIPVVYRDVDDDQARKIMVADNRTADLGDYDDAALIELLQSLPDLDGTGYDGDDLDDLKADLEAGADLDDLEGEPEATMPRRCQQCGYDVNGNPDGLSPYDG